LTNWWQSSPVRPDRFQLWFTFSCLVSWNKDLETIELLYEIVFNATKFLLSRRSDLERQSEKKDIFSDITLIKCEETIILPRKWYFNLQIWNRDQYSLWCDVFYNHVIAICRIIKIPSIIFIFLKISFYLRNVEKG
jgi:hypothetical protein